MLYVTTPTGGHEVCYWQNSAPWCAPKWRCLKGLMRLSLLCRTLMAVGVPWHLEGNASFPLTVTYFPLNLTATLHNSASSYNSLTLCVIANVILPLLLFGAPQVGCIGNRLALTLIGRPYFSERFCVGWEELDHLADNCYSYSELPTFVLFVFV
jgi:hypothetical protein